MGGGGAGKDIRKDMQVTPGALLRQSGRRTSTLSIPRKYIMAPSVNIHLDDRPGRSIQAFLLTEIPNVHYLCLSTMASPSNGARQIDNALSVDKSIRFSSLT